MAHQLGIFSALYRPVSPLRITFAPGPMACMSLRPAGQTIRIASGRAWITCNSVDIVLDSGQQTRLPMSGDAVNISAIGPAALTFEICRSSGR